MTSIATLTVVDTRPHGNLVLQEVTMQRHTLRRAALLALLTTALAGVPAHSGSATIPVITAAQADFSTGMLTVHGKDFIASPLPRVWLGTLDGIFEELQVISAGATHIEAVIGNRQPGSYRLIAQFGQAGLLLSALDITLGVAGPQGERGPQGEQGPKGDTGATGPAGPSGILGLANKKCAPGSFLTGFDAVGDLVCSVVPNPDTTILLWHFDESSGTTASDSSGNGRDGEIAGAVRTEGHDGNGLRFDGGTAGSQYVVLADSDALTPSAITFDLWIKPSRLDLDNQMIIHKYHNNVPTNSDYILYLINDELLFGTRGSETLTTPLTADTWYRITAIADGSNSRLYINGVLKKSGSLSSIPNGTAAFVLGSCLNACAPNNHSFAGLVDEVSIFKGVRTP